MERIWYIQIEGKTTGPFSVADLRANTRITPDTLVWKEGFAEWIPIRDVPELQEIFDEPEQPDEEEVKPPVLPDEEIVLELPQQPSYPFYWLVIILIVFTFLFYRLFWG